MSRTEPDRDSVERRLEAVERALADEEPIERADRIDDLEDRLAELEAAVQAVRGYVGEVRAINEDVEHRADRALRKARALERNLAPDETGRSTTDGHHGNPPAGADGEFGEEYDDSPTEATADEHAGDGVSGQDGESIFRWG